MYMIKYTICYDKDTDLIYNLIIDFCTFGVGCLVSQKKIGSYHPQLPSAAYLLLRSLVDIKTIRSLLQKKKKKLCYKLRKIFCITTQDF